MTLTSEVVVPQKNELDDDLWHRSCGRCEYHAKLKGLPVRFFCGKVVPFVRRSRPFVVGPDVCVVCAEIAETTGCPIHPKP